MLTQTPEAWALRAIAGSVCGSPGGCSAGLPGVRVVERECVLTRSRLRPELGRCVGGKEGRQVQGKLRIRGRGARRFELMELVSCFSLPRSCKSYCIVGRGLESLLSWWRRGSRLKQSSGRVRYSLAPGGEGRGAPPALRCKGAGLGAPGTARRRGCPQGWGLGHLRRDFLRIAN